MYTPHMWKIKILSALKDLFFSIAIESDGNNS